LISRIVGVEGAIASVVVVVAVGGGATTLKSLSLESPIYSLVGLTTDALKRAPTG
jgi:hypothetical protein